jgi:hypothetical protein
MTFIADHLAQHFRTRFGLANGKRDPLLDIAIFSGLAATSIGTVFQATSCQHGVL